MINLGITVGAIKAVVVVVVVVVVIWAYLQELNCSRRAPGYFTKSVTRLHLPHAIIVMLHAYLINVILTPETVAQLVFEQ